MSEIKPSGAPSQAAAGNHARPAQIGKPPRDSGRLWLILPLLVVAAYVPGIGNDYVIWDDDIYIRDNPYLRDVGGLARIWIPSDPVRKYYPLTYTLHWAEFQLWGTWPTGYYVVNVALHAVNAVLVFALLRALGAGSGVALLASALFAVHPMQAASVAWLAARKTLLSTTLALLAFLAYWRSRRAGQVRWARLAYVLFAAALLSKCAAITFLGSAILADWLLLRRRLWDAVAPLAPVLVGVGGCLMYIDSMFESTVGTCFAEPLPLRPLAASAACWFYAGKLLWPTGLALIYPPWTVSFSLVWFLPLVALVAAALGGWVLRRRIGALAVWGAAHFLLTLLPILGLLSFGYLKHSPVGDQYVYAAAPGFFLLVALGLARLARWVGQQKAQLVQLAVGVAAVAALGWLTGNRTLEWRGSEEFWSSAIADHPDFAFGRRRLADAYLNRGGLAEALREYTRLLQDDPDDAQVHNNMGLVLNRLGRPAEALERFRIAAAHAVEDNLPEAQTNLAATQMELGLLPAEITRLTAALASHPDDRETRYALAMALAVDGQSTKAVRHARQLIRDNPDDPRLLYRVAFLLRVAGQNAAAADAYRRAAQLARAQGPAELWYMINREMAELPASAAGD